MAKDGRRTRRFRDRDRKRPRRRSRRAKRGDKGCYAEGSADDGVDDDEDSVGGDGERQWAREDAQPDDSVESAYYTVVAALVLVNLYLLVHVALRGERQSSDNATALAHQTVAMKTAEIAKTAAGRPGWKADAATKDADKFYEKRLPSAYSDVLASLEC